MDFLDYSRKLRNRKPRTVFTQGFLSSSRSPEEPQPSTSKRMKLTRNGNGDSGVANLNPLLMEHVVKNISSYLVDVEDMKSIRTLSRIWRDESLEQWRSTAVLVLTKEVIQTLVKAYLRKNDPRAKPDNDVLIQLFDKPFRNFRYPSDSDGRNRVYPLRPMEVGGPSSIIWEQFFINAKYLDLGDCFIEDQQHILEGFVWILRACPQLKRLDLNPCYSEAGGELENQLAMISSNLGIVSNLETLSIGESLAGDSYLWFVCDFDFYTSVRVYNAAGRYRDLQPLDYFLQTCPNLKSLWMQGNERCLLNTYQSERKIKSFSVVPDEDNNIDNAYLTGLRDYVWGSRPTMKTLVLWLDPWRKWFPLINEAKYFYEILNFAQETLTKLELFFDCEMEGMPNRPLNLASDHSYGGAVLFARGTRQFSNLTHLKLCQVYRKFPGNLILFDFGSLRQMKKLKEFRFEMGLGVAEAWVKKKLRVEDIQEKKTNEVQTEELLLPDLKHFHFHSNFTSEAIQFLGKVATNLKTLEIVFDEENYTTALKTWADLRQVTLLPCSEVVQDLSSGPVGLKIVDRSKDYRKASNYWFNQEKKFPALQMKRICKMTKPR